MELTIQAAHKEQLGPISRQMGKWVDQVLGPGFQRYCPGESWAPAINLYETATHYLVVAELAGVDAEKIDLRVDGRTLVLTGVRQSPVLASSEGEVRLHHMEIDHGQFCRSFDLPADVNSDKVEASYRAGLLWIHLPKKN